MTLPASALRFDCLEFEFRQDRAELDADGALLIEGVATRAGVLQYVDHTGQTFREFRPPSEVFSRESIQSLVGKPVTNGHPDTLLDNTTTRSHQIGTVLSARRDGETVRVQLRVTDTEAITDIRAGKRELSPGYRQRLLVGRGTVRDDIEDKGKRFDATQTQITYNHLAIVPIARSGPVASLERFDDNTRIHHRGYMPHNAEREDQQIQPLQGTDAELKPFKIGAVTLMLPPAAVGLLESLGQQVKTMQGEIATLQASLEGKSEALTPEQVAAGTANESLAEGVERRAEVAAGDPASTIAAVEDSTKGTVPESRSDGGGDMSAELKKTLDTILAGQAAITQRMDALTESTATQTRARGHLERQATEILPIGYRFDKADDLTVMFDAIVAFDPGQKERAEAHRQDASYVQCMFDQTVGAHQQRSASRFDAARSIVHARAKPLQTEDIDIVEAARLRANGPTHAQRMDEERRMLIEGLRAEKPSGGPPPAADTQSTEASRAHVGALTTN